MKDIHYLANLEVLLLDSAEGGVFIWNMVHSSLHAEIKEKQMLDLVSMRIKGDVGGQKVLAFEIIGDGTLWYQGRLCVPDVDDLEESIFAEAHESCYVVHPGLMKIYQGLKEMY